MASQSLRDQNLEDLFNCPWFYGELSRDDATEILNEAVKNDGESWRDIIFLETVSDDIGQNRFAIISAGSNKRFNDSQPFFDEISLLRDWNLRVGVERNRNQFVVRTNPFSLEVLAAVKVASCGFNLETLGLPRMIKEEVKKYQDLNERIKSFD